MDGLWLLLKLRDQVKNGEKKYVRVRVKEEYREDLDLKQYVFDYGSRYWRLYLGPRKDITDILSEWERKGIIKYNISMVRTDRFGSVYYLTLYK